MTALCKMNISMRDRSHVPEDLVGNKTLTFARISPHGTELGAFSARRNFTPPPLPLPRELGVPSELVSLSFWDCFHPVCEPAGMLGLGVDE